MRWLMITTVFCSAMFLSHFAMAQLNKQTEAEIRSFKWQAASEVKLPSSGSEIVNLPDYSVVVGPSAARMREIEDADLDSTVEAEAINSKTSEEVIYSYVNSGYVNSTDWSDVNASEFLAQIRDNTEAANARRKAKGIPEFHVVDWIQEPSINTETHTVSWIIRLKSQPSPHLLFAKNVLNSVVSDTAFAKALMSGCRRWSGMLGISS